MPTNNFYTRTKSQRAEFERLLATAQAPSHDAPTEIPFVMEDFVMPEELTKKEPTPNKRGRKSKIKTDI